VLRAVLILRGILVGADGYCACEHTLFPHELIGERPDRILKLPSLVVLISASFAIACEDVPGLAPNA